MWLLVRGGSALSAVGALLSVAGFYRRRARRYGRTRRALSLLRCRLTPMSQLSPVFLTVHLLTAIVARWRRLGPGLERAEWCWVCW
jgi:hypothetical protein